MKKSCDTCAKKDTCKRTTGFMLGFGNTESVPGDETEEEDSDNASE